ncbi:mucin-5AC-like isoform X1 [Lucilia sericata]|uniref:mucin-5AC-like isoform X1 n=3 Tax=Lucilia sericata TaxID=13632 RepID=UPI0018A7F274|nr:mucin-5AC-like isoform X1 [Lucilia sericata]
MALEIADKEIYITRSQRVQQQLQTNDSRSSPSSTALNAITQQQQQQDLNSEIRTVETNGHTIKTNGEDKEQQQEQEEEMTNNSGKKSKTTATTTTNSKELKINIPLTSDTTSTTPSSTIAATPAAAVAAAAPDSKCSSTAASSSACPTAMSALQHKLMEHHHHNHHVHQQQTCASSLQQLKISNKHNFINSNNFNNNLNLINNINNHHNCNNNYATPTASSVLKQRKQNANSTTTTTTNCSSSIPTTTAILSPSSKFRKCPLSPLIITTNAPLFSNTSSSLSSPSQQLVTSGPVSQQQHFMKLSPASPILGLTLSPLSPNSSSTCSSSVHLVRTTKTTRLRAAALDKKKDEEKQLQQQQRFTSPTSPKPQQHHSRASPSSCSSDYQKLTSGSEAEHHKMSSANSSPTHRGNKKLIPSVSVSMKQNLSETHCTASRSNSLRSNANSPKSPKLKSQSSSTECTVKITASPKVKTKSASNQKSSPTHNEDYIDADFMEINDLPVSPLGPEDEGSTATRPRCSTMYTDSDKSKSSLSNGGQNNEKLLELSPVHKSRTCNRSPRRNEDRDKSSKRKSNLNRSQNEEATPDGDDSAMRRRRRREMGMSRPLVPNDDASLKALISPQKTRVPSPTKPAIRNDLSYHMEMARRGLDLATTSERRRAQTASPKNIKDSPSPKSSYPPTRISKRSDTVAIGELRKERSSEVNRKLNERTRTGLEEIMKIVENVSDSCSPNPTNAIADLTQSMNRLRASQERERQNETESLNLPSNKGEEQRRPSPVKHATFVQEECIYYEPDPLEHIEMSNGEAEHLKGGMMRSLRMLKAKSIERETAAFEPAKLSPILRRKSTDCPPNSLNQGSTITATPNHIVSILKKKDHLSAGESSSASSNASPVTFSSSVMDTPSKQKRAGILKKRSSLDESRYYSRSHSPDERSILIKSARRNSLEEVANGSSSSSSAQGAGHHGILKQSSYDSSKSDGCPSASREPQQPHSILKKKDSTSTPSDGADHAPKHVSISQAVILAAAELSAAVETGDKFPNDDNYTPNNEEYDIKPILKLDSSMGDESVKPPKPILKKKSSGDSDEHEIKPILKTSRKSSREEFEFGPYSDSESQQEPQVRPILKTDSPSKRRSLGEPDTNSPHQEGEQRETLSPFLLKRRTRSLERHDQAPVIDLAAALNAIATSQALPSELVSSLTNSTAGSNISVAERIKSVEKFLANQSGVRSSPGESASATAAVNTSWESPLQNDPNSSYNTAGSVKILKPSVIRRDLYKDRFKTQPVTSDEKNFFKNNVSSNNDTLPTGSAFKPAQSLEGLGFAHLSSHGNQSPNAPPSAFTLTRSFTQPLSSSINSPPQSSSSFKAGIPVPLPRKSPARSSLLCSQDTANLTLSFTGDSGLSCNSNSERIFEMSSLEQDVDMAENQEPKTPLNKDSSESSASSGGVVRTNSVRARANMFQQMQEKTNNGAALNREERTSPKRVPRRLSPSPAVNTDEPKTPNNPPPDDEIEPSSLPVSERLRFFSSLSEAGKRSSCSFTRSPPFNSIERSSSIGSYHYYMATTPRSSTSLSSASVTPTPMECPLPIFIESPTILRKDSSASREANEPVVPAAEPPHDLTDSRFAIKADIVKTSPFLQVNKQALPIPAHVAETETTPTSTLTPTMKRIKLKTIGKLMLPSTFLNNDRNNNNSKESSSNRESSSATDSNGENENSGPPKKIGKIKSPFIENCNQKQQKQMQINTKCMKFDYNNKTQNSLTALTSLENSADHHNMDISSNSNGISNGNGLNQRKYQNSSLQINGHHHNEDFSTDSGKENVDTSLQEQTTPVVEMRRKFTRKANTSQSFNTSNGSGISRQLTPRSASLNGPHSSPQVDDKYAKYFGVATSSTKSTKSNQQQAPPLPKQPPPSSPAQQDQFGQQLEKTPQPQVMAINRNVRLWHSSGRGVKRMSSVINELKKFEDIVVTDRELKLASKEFDNLLHNDTLLKHSSKELDRIFSSIV